MRVWVFCELLYFAPPFAGSACPLMCIHFPRDTAHDEFPQSSEPSSYAPLPSFYLNEFQTIKPPYLLSQQITSMDNNTTTNNTLDLLQNAEGQSQAAARPEGVGSSKKRRSRSNLKQREFVKHRDVLKQLYMHEEKTLDDVMGVLKSKHGFEAR